MKPGFLKDLRQILPVLVLLVAASCSSTPKSGPGPNRFLIGKDPDTLNNFEFPVAVFLVNSITKPTIESLGVQQYFQEPSKYNASATLVDTFVIRSGSSAPHEIKLSKQQNYPNSSHLVVLANLPMDVSGLARDPRRLTLPLDRVKWPENTRQVEITWNPIFPRVIPAPRE